MIYGMETRFLPFGYPYRGLRTGSQWIAALPRNDMWIIVIPSPQDEESNYLWQGNKIPRSLRFLARSGLFEPNDKRCCYATSHEVCSLSRRTALDSLG